MVIYEFIEFPSSHFSCSASLPTDSDFPNYPYFLKNPPPKYRFPCSRCDFLKVPRFQIPKSYDSLSFVVVLFKKYSQTIPNSLTLRLILINCKMRFSKKSQNLSRLFKGFPLSRFLLYFFFFSFLSVPVLIFICPYFTHILFLLEKKIKFWSVCFPYFLILDKFVTGKGFYFSVHHSF